MSSAGVEAVGRVALDRDPDGIRITLTVGIDRLMPSIPPSFNQNHTRHLPRSGSQDGPLARRVAPLLGGDGTMRNFGHDLENDFDRFATGLAVGAVALGLAVAALAMMCWWSWAL